MLDIWPALPIVVPGGHEAVHGIENAIAAHRHNVKLSSRMFQIGCWKYSQQCHHNHSLY